MAIRNIRVDDDPILRKKSREVTEFNERLFSLLDDMKDTMYASGGVGLAGPQVGALRRVVVMDVSTYNRCLCCYCYCYCYCYY